MLQQRTLSGCAQGRMNPAEHVEWGWLQGGVRVIEGGDSRPLPGSARARRGPQQLACLQKGLRSLPWT